MTASETASRPWRPPDLSVADGRARRSSEGRFLHGLIHNSQVALGRRPQGGGHVATPAPTDRLRPGPDRRRDRRRLVVRLPVRRRRDGVGHDHQAGRRGHQRPDERDRLRRGHGRRRRDRRPQLRVVGHRHRGQREGRRHGEGRPGARDDRLGRARRPRSPRPRPTSPTRRRSSPTTRAPARPTRRSPPTSRASTSANDALTNAQEALAGASLVATFDGTVASVDLTVGEQLGSGGTGGTDADRLGQRLRAARRRPRLRLGQRRPDAQSRRLDRHRRPRRSRWSAPAASPSSSRSTAPTSPASRSARPRRVTPSTSSSSSSRFRRRARRLLPRRRPAATDGRGDRHRRDDGRRLGNGAGTTPRRDRRRPRPARSPRSARSPTPAPGVATYPVTVAFDADADDVLRRLDGHRRHHDQRSATNVVQVPALAVTTTDGVSTVTVATDGTATGPTETRTVTTGLTAERQDRDHERAEGRRAGRHLDHPARRRRRLLAAGRRRRRGTRRLPGRSPAAFDRRGRLTAVTEPSGATPSPPAVIELVDVSKIYATGALEVAALRDVSLRIDENEFVAIIGPSGSGKSTLMHILGCLDVPTSGVFRLAGHDVAVVRRGPARRRAQPASSASCSSSSTCSPTCRRGATSSCRSSTRGVRPGRAPRAGAGRARRGRPRRPGRPPARRAVRRPAAARRRRPGARHRAGDDPRRRADRQPRLRRRPPTCSSLLERAARARAARSC